MKVNIIVKVGHKIPVELIPNKRVIRLVVTLHYKVQGQTYIEASMSGHCHEPIEIASNCCLGTEVSQGLLCSSDFAEGLF